MGFCFSALFSKLGTQKLVDFVSESSLPLKMLITFPRQGILNLTKYVRRQSMKRKNKNMMEYFLKNETTKMTAYKA